MVLRGTLHRRWWFPVDGTLASLSQFYVALKLAGVLSFTVIDPAGCRLGVTLADWCLVLFGTVGKVWGLAVGIGTGQWRDFLDSEVEVIQYCVGCSMFLMVLVGVLLPYYVMFQLEKIEEGLGDLKAFDEEMKRLGYPRNHQFNHFITTLFMMICLSMLGLIMLATLFLRAVDFLLDAWFFLVIVNISCVGYTLYHTALNVALLGIHSRLQLLNRCFLERNQAGERLQLAKLYDKLCDVSGAISVVMSIPHVIFFLNIFFMHVISCYGIARVLLGVTTARETANAWLYLGWSGFFNTFLLQTVLFDSAVQQQTAKFGAAVHRSLNESQDSQDVDGLLQLAEQVASRAPKVSFYLFELDPSMLIKACGELATYLLILIQFDMQ